ncbi:flavodoxin family protein [Methanosarcina sp.]|jgi:multimeric flavodoxin WrbA|uniref:flavodoxin family protein n=1 Tax=Methanosarcina sp. TaxID=2213 RepID=UPI0029884734|nr:flavodoxin family protein [Methanosarcina sp.]MDW5551065.1 flavodoxin family protein [Methanosarcina sp.]MDW5554977.1 flavodoxin family protein [Methanosarcina sp.]MDW5558377.1 flavodoxin family protein [Methanosarcina sp.]
MKVIAINGSPRKKWNTATLLEKALEGANSEGAEVELIHLYDFNFKGCTSCFSCKLKGGKSYGKCAMKDELTPVLEKLKDVDAVILGSPIYLGNSTGEMRSFMERYVFPYLTYSNNLPSLYPKNTPVGFIYTMGVKEEYFDMLGLRKTIELNENFTKRIFGYSESLYSTDTYQFDDYSKYVADRFDPEEKAKRRKEVFPHDCEKAFEMGVRFVKRQRALEAQK